MQAFRIHGLRLFFILSVACAVLFVTLHLPAHETKKTECAVTNAAYKTPLHENHVAREKSVLIHAPHIRQNPELPRGCEVTSLAMLLQQAGVSVDKMELARNIHHVPYRQNQRFGNPHEGFVGSMEHLHEHGYGVYHEPLARLGRDYLPEAVVDLSGKSFDDAVLAQLQKGKPVVVITNAHFRPLSEHAFQYWRTDAGTVKITYQEHAVLVTGYDQSHIVFNDPLGKKNTAADRKAFIKSWEQMGRQAISIQHLA